MNAPPDGGLIYRNTSYWMRDSVRGRKQLLRCSSHGSHREASCKGAALAMPSGCGKSTVWCSPALARAFCAYVARCSGLQ